MLEHAHIQAIIHILQTPAESAAVTTFVHALLALVLLRIPSSRLHPWTFPQFVRVQILGFETYVQKIFHLISQIYTTKTSSECHWRHFHLPIDILQQQHSSACCLREVLIYAICSRLIYGYQTTRCKHMFIILSSRIRNRVRIRRFFLKIRPLTRFWDP